MMHYHIRWSNSELDWEPFGTREEAEASALNLVRPNENYTIQEFDETCSECATLTGQIEKMQSVGAFRKLRWLTYHWGTVN